MRSSPPPFFLSLSLLFSPSTQPDRCGTRSRSVICLVLFFCFSGVCVYMCICVPRAYVVLYSLPSFFPLEKRKARGKRAGNRFASCDFAIRGISHEHLLYFFFDDACQKPVIPRQKEKEKEKEKGGNVNKEETFKDRFVIYGTRLFKGCQKQREKKKLLLLAEYRRVGSYLVVYHERNVT